MKAFAVLAPSTSKRLIAKGVVAHSIVQTAIEGGTVVVTLGTTNAFVAAELSGDSIDHGAFAAGVVDDRWNLNARIGEERDFVFRNGARISIELGELLDSLGEGDVIIKGGNALDPFGTVGVLMAAPDAGTIGRYVPTALARGVDLVVPISVGKSVHTPIPTIAGKLGSRRLAFGDGLPCGMFPLTGDVVTEIEALEILFSVRADHVASGGIGVGAGSVSLVLEGEADDVRAAYDLLQRLKGAPEPLVEGRR